MATVLRDKPFTIAAAAVLRFPAANRFMQPELAAGLFKASRDAGIHTAVETCLHVPWKYIAPSLPYIDLFLADLSMSPTGRLSSGPMAAPRGCWKISSALAAAGKNGDSRPAPIQGFSDEETIKAITDFAADELHVGEIHFLPYHAGHQ